MNGGVLVTGDPGEEGDRLGGPGCGESWTAGEKLTGLRPRHWRGRRSARRTGAGRDRDCRRDWTALPEREPLAGLLYGLRDVTAGRDWGRVEDQDEESA